MVRLQKIAYEQIVNSKALGRARVLSTPKKWMTANPNQQNAFVMNQFFNGTFLGRALQPLFRAWHNFQRSDRRKTLIQQGITFEDKFLHTDTELRRSVLWEHVARESLHPYQWLLKVRRRARYWKIERASRGFFVPEYIAAQAKTQTYRDYLKLDSQWVNFWYNNYMSDMTPTARRTTVQMYGPDLALNYGVWNDDAWERFFFNERDQGYINEKEAKTVRDPKKFPYDLTTAEGKRKFQSYTNSINQKYPGIVAPQGQKFDFNKHYAQLGV